MITKAQAAQIDALLSDLVTHERPLMDWSGEMAPRGSTRTVGRAL